MKKFKLKILFDTGRNDDGSWWYNVTYHEHAYGGIGRNSGEASKAIQLFIMQIEEAEKQKFVETGRAVHDSQYLESRLIDIKKISNISEEKITEIRDYVVEKVKPYAAPPSKTMPIILDRIYNCYARGEQWEEPKKRESLRYDS